MEHTVLLFSLSRTNKTYTFFLLCFQLLRSVKQNTGVPPHSGIDNSTNFA